MLYDFPVKINVMGAILESVTYEPMTSLGYVIWLAVAHATRVSWRIMKKAE